MKQKIYSNVFLKARINHDAMSTENLATMVGMDAEDLQAKIDEEEYFDEVEMHNIVNSLNVSSGEECRLLFFFYKESEETSHINLYKAILDNDIPLIKVALEIKMPIKTLIDKISGNTEFRWNEVIAIKKKFFDNYSLEELFRKGA